MLSWWRCWNRQPDHQHIVVGDNGCYPVEVTGWVALSLYPLPSTSPLAHNEWLPALLLTSQQWSGSNWEGQTKQQMVRRDRGACERAATTKNRGKTEKKQDSTHPPYWLWSTLSERDVLNKVLLIAWPVLVIIGPYPFYVFPCTYHSHAYVTACPGHSLTW